MAHEEVFLILIKLHPAHFLIADVYIGAISAIA